MKSDERMVMMSPRVWRWWMTSIGAFVVVAVLADAWALLRGSEAGGVARGAAVLLASAGWATLVGTAFFGVLLIVNRLSLLLRARPGRHFRIVALVVAVSPVALALGLGTRDLLDGPGVRGKSWVAGARAAAWALSVLGPALCVVVAEMVLRRWTRHPGALGGRRGRLGFVALSGLSVVALVFLDRTVHPYRYPTAHLLLWLGILLAVGVSSLVIHWTRPETPRATFVLAAALAVLGMVSWVQEPLEDSRARATAFRDTLFLKRSLAHLAPAPDVPTRRVDPALLAQLGAEVAVDPRILDEALPNRRRFNVLLVTVDALRPDRLVRAGYRRTLTPHLHRLLTRSVEFTQAWTPYPATRLAFASAFRGVYASATDVHRELTKPGSVPKDARQPTLPGLLGRAGFSTQAVTGFSRFMMREWFPSLPEGFETFNAHAAAYADERHPHAEQITAHALEALDHLGDRQFFLWVHYFDPHHPYTPFRGPTLGTEPIDLYDAEIQQTDSELGRFLHALEQRGRTADTVIVMFSDHGEAFGEHGKDFHATDLTEVQIHVPLAVAIPGMAPRTIQTPVDLTDVMPTVLETLGLPLPKDLHGHSLLRFVLQGDPKAADAKGWPPPFAFSELDEPDMVLSARQFAVRHGATKLTFDVGARSFELFQLDVDPGERTNLAFSNREEVSRLRALLDTFRGLTEGAHRSSGNPRAEETVTLALSGDINRQIWALQSLAAEGCPPGLRDLVVSFTLPGKDQRLRLPAIRALATRNGDETTRLLERLLHDADRAAAREAAVALAQRSPSDPAPLRQLFEGSLDDLGARQGLRARVALGDQDAKEEARALLVMDGLAIDEAVLLARALAATPSIEFADDLRRLQDSLEGAPIVDRLLTTGGLAGWPRTLREPLMRRAILRRERPLEAASLSPPFEAGSEASCRRLLEKVLTSEEAYDLCMSLGVPAWDWALEIARDSPEKVPDLVEASPEWDSFFVMYSLRGVAIPLRHEVREATVPMEPGTSALLRYRLAADRSGTATTHDTQLTVSWRTPDRDHPVALRLPLPACSLASSEEFHGAVRVWLPPSLPAGGHLVLAFRSVRGG